MGEEPFFWFEDAVLQRKLAEALDETGIPYRQAADGRVWYREEDEEAVGDAACAVRTGWETAWHLVSWDEEPDTCRFRELLAQACVPFVAEHAPGFTWFLLRNVDRPACDDLARQLWKETAAR